MFLCKERLRITYDKVPDFVKVMEEQIFMTISKKYVGLLKLLISQIFNEI
jgi:hypothetical protein